MIDTHKTVTNCYLKFAQVEGVFSMSFEPVKQTNRKKIAKIGPKISKIYEISPNWHMIHMD